MFFFFFPPRIAVAYSSFTTKVSKKEIREIGFKKWIQETGCYQKLLSSLPQPETSEQGEQFQEIRLEADGLSNKCLELRSIDNANELPNLLFDVLSGHNKNRPRLNFLIDEYYTAGFIVPNINVLGESIDKIVSIYERCIEKGKFICVLDSTSPSGVSEYSLADINGIPFHKEKQLEVVNKLASMSSSKQKKEIRDLRGTTKRALGLDFWTAYFLYEITMEIPENFAYIITGMARSTFIIKCKEIEENFRQLNIRIGSDFYTYEDLLMKTLASKSLNIEDYYDIPKRNGSLPKSSKDATFEKLRAQFDSYRATSSLDDQAILGICCDELGFKPMLYFDYRRYCAKMDNPGTKGLYKYYHYNQQVIDSVNNYIEKMQNLAELTHTTYNEREAKNMLLSFYKLDI